MVVFLRLASLGLGLAALGAAVVALVVPERRLRRWSVVTFAFAALDAVSEIAARHLAPASIATRLAIPAAMLACAAPAARWVVSALADASAD
jgi:hypothetical protein